MSHNCLRSCDNQNSIGIELFKELAKHDQEMNISLIFEQIFKHTSLFKNDKKYELEKFHKQGRSPSNYFMKQKFHDTVLNRNNTETYLYYVKCNSLFVVAYKNEKLSSRCNCYL